MDSSSPSPPTSSSPIWKHQVYPSLNGPKVRKTVLSHIVQSLTRKGIDLFICDTLVRGKSLCPNLIEGIRGSEIAIVVLSSWYPSSAWRLDELVEIMKCKEELGQKVFTVFYEEESSVVRNQSGVFGEKFKEICKNETEERIGKWIKALRDVANIPGEHSTNWTNEADMIEKIATDVSNKLNISIPLVDIDDKVGMRAHMEMMQKVVRLDLNEVRMIGIWGPHGIGKTTIAEVLYNQISHRFQLRTFMYDIKTRHPIPCLDDHDAQLQLQRQMISNLGVEKERLKDKKVILVLDNADLLHLNALMKEIQGFGNGSRIIVITDNLSLLEEYRINDVYKVNFPSWEEAFQIFCIHAFGQKHPHDGFKEISWEFVNLAGCIPSELQRLGFLVVGKSKLDWKNILQSLKRNENVQTEADARIERTVTTSLMDVKVKPPQYQVFINYRGEELRNSFVGYLVEALQRNEIKVFADYQGQRGEVLSVLFKRIEDSRIAIVVFSNRYTESEWCLNELAMIKERAQKRLLKVLPIFFKVNTINVKRLKGEFGDHFRDREHEYMHDEPQIKRWKEAISYVSNIMGREFYEESMALEANFVEKIVVEVLEMLQTISKEERGQSSSGRKKFEIGY